MKTRLQIICLHTCNPVMLLSLAMSVFIQELKCRQSMQARYALDKLDTHLLIAIKLQACAMLSLTSTMSKAIFITLCYGQSLNTM